MKNTIKIGDFVRIKEKYAFEISPLLHYGQVVDIDLDEDLKLNFDRRYGHDSFIWVQGYMYEIIN